MAKFFILDDSGHTTLEYDLSSDAGTKEAMEKFDALLKEGAAGTRKEGSTDYRQIRRFDQLEDETVFLRPMQGG